MASLMAVVKYGGGQDDLAWRFPNDGVGTWTKLVVGESQEAILLMNGKAFDSFTPGQYDLTVENIPFLNGALNLTSGGRYPLPTDIWYINKGQSIEVKWGTPAPIQIPDPKYKALIPLRALGQFSIQVQNPSVFLSTLIGVLTAFDKESLIIHFRSRLLNMLKDSILAFLALKEISILEATTCIDELSEHVRNQVMPAFTGYGVDMKGFKINNIKLSEDSPIVRQYNEALAKKAVSELVGNEYVPEKPITPEPVPEPSPVIQVAESVIPVVQVPESVIPVIQQAQSVYVPIKKTCPVCYFDMEPEDRYCKECNHDTMPELGISKEPTPTIIASRNEEMQLSEESKTKICPKCATEVNVNVRFCPVCGFDTEKPTTQTIEQGYSENNTIKEQLPTSERTCLSCNTKMKPNQKFCHKCGSRS